VYTKQSRNSAVNKVARNGENEPTVKDLYGLLQDRRQDVAA